ncbi:MrcB family domain-containing protein [Streptomyces tsukubensis]|uniref:Type IV methyl-directed restriction enzyme EcoKMcrB subunit DNA-binding domain-containing protein n=1 Tax=Streptomyces tsukubensis TaxID=83656 RepID=A0A1V4A6W7_9ACTN|nr:DUF3578 domain-containing protein [Streptomyces tsukubensis]OON76961.1 hypothetical protein B1H18_19555 [Streptomyces tsukubensis]QFR93810.1 DUF3578 domain-containing protein [Streptomyces tsukubensis]
MGIRDMLGEIATTYDRHEGTKREVKGQQVLRAVERRKDLSLPSNLTAKGHGGRTDAVLTPWVGLMDPTITSDPRQGVYLAYIFSADLVTVSLTLQQGVELLSERLGRGVARLEHLRRDAARLRRAISRQRRQGWDDVLTLKSDAERPRAYEAASVIAKSYATADLPDESTLQEDLRHAVTLLHRTAPIHQVWWLGDGGGDELVVTYEGAEHIPSDDPLAGFQPKSSADYVATIAAKQMVKKRHHEALIRDFGHYVVDLGFDPIIRLMHPRDLVLRRRGADGTYLKDHWLVEAKVVRKSNPTQAVREAVGQLREYSYFLYSERKKPVPHLLGLFSEEVGTYSDYLEDQGIASIWRAERGWAGSPSAEKWGLV